MAGIASVSVSIHVSSSHPHITAFRYENPICKTLGKCSASAVLYRSQASILSFRNHVVLKERRIRTHLVTKASSSSATGGEFNYIEEPVTNVKFQTSINLPGCSSPLLLLGTGYREKVFAIIGVKVYAAGLYVHNSILSKLRSWSGRSGDDIQNDTALFKSIYEDSLEKTLQIVLVRDVDGKTFWDALNDAVSPRIKSPSSIDEYALSTFRSTFKGRPLKKGTLIFLTWPKPSKMLVSISPEGLPSGIDVTIESRNVTEALFDVFLGDGPVSPTLKASVSNGLASMLK